MLRGLAQTPATCRLGVDIGGTFTDAALDVGGVITSAKVLTDYDAHERAVIAAIKTVTEAAGVEPSDIGTIIHGTTLATNALIERRGARTAFVTTEGFRDVIEMRTENRFEQYDLDLVLPPPLIARADRFTLRERVGADGSVLIAPDVEEMRTLARRIEGAGYESVAVGFLHSYANDAHEKLMGDVLQSVAPGLSVSLSAEVSPKMREYERFNTVCANAYVRPPIAAYLSRLQAALTGEGITCPLFVMHSGGGVVSLETAMEFPVRLVESGPAGGAMFAAEIARRHGLDAALSFDLGGTTAKICLIESGAPQTAERFEVARSYRFKKGSGMPISIPVVDMVEIGAGGGSIAHVDAMRQIRVGPESATSRPGPACYDLGGNEPTVTDANLMVGRLDALNFAGGTMRLSAGRAETVIAEKIGATLNFGAVEAAHGIIEVVDENMANVGRMHAVENGKDLSRFVMVTFGGAGPLHAARLCRKMGISSFLVPPGAGVGSAIGFLLAPFAYEASRTAFMRMSSFNAASVAALLTSLGDEASKFVARAVSGAAAKIEYTVSMRYAGQGWEIPVALPPGFVENPEIAALTRAFERAYEELFGRAVEGLDIEMTSWSAKASLPVSETAFIERIDPVREAEPASFRQLYSPEHGAFHDAASYQREALSPGDRIVGPAVIVERETASVVPEGFEALVLRDFCLRVSQREIAT
ncbi:MAG: hydantoinase/oxoprolinase family protein [Brucellaceae bacterium]|nr:hydantoinase/oxoprolinase family protein [Brucellaceae bacterium]